MTSSRQTDLRFQPSESRGKGIVSRVHKGEVDRITAYLPPELGAKLRTACAARRMELSEMIAHAVQDWLDQVGAESKQPPRAERAATSEPAPQPRGDRSAANASRSGTKAAPYTRSDGLETRSTTVHLPTDMLRELRITAAERDEHMSAIVTEAVYEWFMRRSTPAAPPETASRVPFSSYMSLADADELRRLVEATGKSRVQLLSEAFALLFEHNET